MDLYIHFSDVFMPSCLNNQIQSHVSIILFLLLIKYRLQYFVILRCSAFKAESLDTYHTINYKVDVEC
jgi:hypothetical protein